MKEIKLNNLANYWVDFNMLMLELDLHRSNAARIVKAYKDIANPTDWDKLECKEAVGRVVVSECIMAWCKDFKFSSDEVKDIINKEEQQVQTFIKYVMDMREIYPQFKQMTLDEIYEYLNQKETVWALEIEKDLNVK